MITLYLQAHPHLPIFLTIDLGNESQFYSRDRRLHVPQPGENVLVTKGEMTMSFIIGRIEAINEVVAIYSHEDYPVLLTFSCSNIVPSRTITGGEILAY